MVGYDQACMTKMINISVRIGSLNLVNDDVVQEIKKLISDQQGRPYRRSGEFSG